MIRAILAATAVSFGIAAAHADEIQSGVLNPGSFAPVAQSEAAPQPSRATDEILSGVQNPGTFGTVTPTVGTFPSVAVGRDEILSGS